MKISTLVVAAGLVAGLSGSAFAGTEVQLDVNSLTAVASGTTFGTSFTGSLTLSKDGNSSLANVLKNGVGSGLGFGGPYSGTALMFAATFDFVAGKITGTSLSVGVDTNGDTVIDDTYMAVINASGVKNILNDSGSPGSFIVAASTRDGTFSGLTFGGVDVSEFFAFLAPGNFINFKISGAAVNSQNRMDDDVDIDIFARTQIIPLPSPIGMASLGLIGVAGIRRRRSA